MFKKSCVALILLLTMAAPMAFSHPAERIFNYSINVPYKFRMGDYVVPPGRYTLNQVRGGDPNLFYLHPIDLTHGSIAIIRTTRIEFSSQPGHVAAKTDLLLKMDEGSGNETPVIRGRTIPANTGGKSSVYRPPDTVRLCESVIRLRRVSEYTL